MNIEEISDKLLSALALDKIGAKNIERGGTERKKESVICSFSLGKEKFEVVVRKI